MTKKNIPFAKPIIGDMEKTAVLEALQSPILAHGPLAKKFEEEFSTFLGNGASVVTTSSCMASLHLAAIHFGLKPGDEVIVPAQTHVATAHAVEWVGARPVFVDADPETGNLTAKNIEKALTANTRAIFVVHFAGIPCNMPAIMDLACKKNLKVVEDCALAIGSRWQGKHVGLFGDAGCFSFYPVKHMTTGEGGMFVSRHQDVTLAVAKRRAFGMDKGHVERKISGTYDVTELGLNYRMSEIQAALGIVQTGRMEEFLQKRRRNFKVIQDSLQGIEAVRVLDSNEPDGANSHYCLVTVLQGRLRGQRDRIKSLLSEVGIGTSVYYPHPVPRMSYYRKKYGYEASLYPVAEEISDQGIALPVGPHLTDSDLDFVASQLKSILLKDS